MSDLAWGEMPYDSKTPREVIDDYVLIRGDLVAEYAREQLADWIDRYADHRSADMEARIADAWDEGYRAAASDLGRRINPYRALLDAAPAGGAERPEVELHPATGNPCEFPAGHKDSHRAMGEQLMQVFGPHLTCSGPPSPLHEIIEAIEAKLDDADQITDSLRHPNRIAVWGVRRVLMRFGGKPHRWPVPAEFCAECEHLTTTHQDECNHRDCDCLLSGREAAFGRDEEVDDEITRALWEDGVTNGEPWALDAPSEVPHD